MSERYNSLNKELYNVLIVGAGQIGAFYDHPEDKNILSHAHAFTAHPCFRLLGFVDRDRSRADLAAQIWGGRVFDSTREALESEQVDVVCVAVPDEWHFDYLRELAGSKVRLVLAEKPLTQTWSEALEIKQRYATDSAPAVAVNYTRRFVPEFQELGRRIQQNEFGQFLCGTGYYGKGLIHNGSHLIDLLRFLLGEIEEVRWLDEESDYYAHDPSISGQLGFAEGGRAVLQVVDCRPYSVFELELFFAGKRIRILDSGFVIEELDVKEDELFPDYRKLEPAASTRTSLGQAMYFMADNIYRYLAFNNPLYCTLEDACRVMKICRDLREGRDE